jgi:hypothetical protein
MARRRLLPFLVAAAALLAPGSALAAPGFRPAETRDTLQPSSVAPDVATDADGNSVAV